VILSHVLCLLFRGKTWLCNALVHMEIEPLQQYTSGYSEVRVKGLYLPMFKLDHPELGLIPNGGTAHTVLVLRLIGECGYKASLLASQLH